MSSQAGQQSQHQRRRRRAPAGGSCHTPILLLNCCSALLPPPEEHDGLSRPCYFLDKVYHAQLAGADAVLVVNDDPGDLSTAVAPKDEDSSRSSGGLDGEREGGGEQVVDRSKG